MAKKLFEIDTILTFRAKYIIEANELTDALDEITMKDSGSLSDHFEDVSQKFMGEVISNTREVSASSVKNLEKELNKDPEEITSIFNIRKVSYQESQ